MVSTITESFFQQQFASWGHDRLQSCQWLQLRAANGLAIPYVGYLELDVVLCGKVIPRCGVLVVKDPPGAVSSAPGILGMNVIRNCYRELFGTHGPSLFALPPVPKAPGPVFEALQQYHQSSVNDSNPRSGAVRVRGERAVRIPGGVLKLVASTCPEQASGQAALFEPSDSGLPGGLLASSCLVRVARGTAYIPVVNVGMADVLLYPRTCLGSLCGAQVISLPRGVTEVKPTIARVSAQEITSVAQDGLASIDLATLPEENRREVGS